MTSTDLPALPPDALARIEEARKTGHRLALAARENGEQIWRNATAIAIGSDSDLLLYARNQAHSVLAHGHSDAFLLFFNVLTYECFESVASISEFDVLLEKANLIARREFPGAAIDLAHQKRAWTSRERGRAMFQSAAGGRGNLTFWRDMQMQFQAIECPYVHAVPGNGWWHISGLPTAEAEQRNVLSQLTLAISRAVTGFGFADSTVALAVWLDNLAQRSDHYWDRCINNLCLASAEQCKAFIDSFSQVEKTNPPQLADTGAAAIGDSPDADNFHPDLVRPVASLRADEPTRHRRREILKQYRRDNDLDTNADLARHLGMSPTAIEGIVRGDRTRYGKEKLSMFLEKIGVTPETW